MLEEMFGAGLFPGNQEVGKSCKLEAMRGGNLREGGVRMKHRMETQAGIRENHPGQKNTREMHMNWRITQV